MADRRATVANPFADIIQTAQKAPRPEPLRPANAARKAVKKATKTPARIVALALGPDDGVLCYGRVVVLRGRAVPWVKALVERWVVRLWPLPYELFRRLPALA